MDELLTTVHSAEATNLSKRTLERFRWAGTGPKFVRLGRRVFYRRADLESWIAECTFGSTSEADTRTERRLDPAAKSSKKNADPQ